MCLPVKVLKCVVGFNAWVTILMGVMAIISGVVIHYNAGDVLSQLSSKSGYSPSAFVDCFYIFGSALVLFGLFGIIGGSRRNAYCLFIFNIFVVVTLVVFAIIGAAAIVITERVGEPTTDNCLSKLWSSQIQAGIALNASETLCQPGCVCYIQNPKSFNLTGYNFTSDPSLVKNLTQYSDCPTFPTVLTPGQQLDYQFLASTEKTFGCAGWCTSSPFFQFTDVNIVPKTSETCYQKSNDAIKSYGNATAGVTLTIALIMFLTILFSFCLCCHPDQKNQAHSNYYQRMAYYDQ